MKHSIPITLSSILALAGACSSSPSTGSSQSAGTTTGSGGGGGAGGDLNFGGGGMGSGCPSQILCGDGLCCPSGQECVEGACALACASQVRCGSTCCNGGELCSGGSCVTPNGPCVDSVDCGPKEYCEPVLNKCLPEAPGDPTCQVPRPKATFAPVLLWSFTTPVARPSYDQTVSAPLIVDADKDGTPDVFISTGDINLDNGVNAGYLRLLDGKTGAEKWDETKDALDPKNTVNVTFSPAVADLDGDGKVEIVAVGAPAFDLIAFHADGSLAWRSHKMDLSPFTFQSFYASTIAVADLDHDGKGEVVIGGAVFDSTGALVSGEGRERQGSGSLQYGSSSSIIVDVDGDGNQEVVVGNAAYRKDGSALWSLPALDDGYPAIADLDNDGTPELVVATAKELRVHRADTGQVLHQLTLVSASVTGWPGSPAIADFDGDGRPDIALQFVDGSNKPCTTRVFGYDKAAGLTQRWSAPLYACSGFLTPTAFDFDGDGEVEVLAHDDCYVSVLRGKDGSEELRLPASHATWTEFVSVADVDGDHSADILFSTNDSYGGKNQAASYYNPVCQWGAGQAASHGLFVYHDPKGQWMPTRRVWNQQAYHITNIKSDGSLPNPEAASFGPAGYNNYRVSLQGKGEGNAPDLVVSLGASTASCPAALELVVAVQNQGSLGVPAGLSVSIYEGTAPSGVFLGTVVTTKALLPGATEKLPFPLPKAPTVPSAFYTVVDDNNGNGGVVLECVETNNTGMIGGVICPQPK